MAYIQYNYIIHMYITKENPYFSKKYNIEGELWDLMAWKPNQRLMLVKKQNELQHKIYM